MIRHGKTFSDRYRQQQQEKASRDITDKKKAKPLTAAQQRKVDRLRQKVAQMNRVHLNVPNAEIR